MRKNPHPVQLALWIIGVLLTGIWVIFFVGLLTLEGMGGGFDLGSRYYAFLLVGAGAWLASIVIALATRSRKGFWISTLPLVLAAAVAVISIHPGLIFPGGFLR